MNYNVEKYVETHTDKTLDKVYEAMFAAGMCIRTARAAINNMQNAGILFRERGGETCPTEQNPEHNTTP